jgi:hypothetical protein
MGAAGVDYGSVWDERVAGPVSGLIIEGFLTFYKLGQEGQC